MSRLQSDYGTGTWIIIIMSNAFFFKRDLLAEVPPCALGKRKLFVHGHARC
jgi:hypothetical protein